MIKNNKGIAMVTVIIFSVIMAILVGAILILSRGHYHSTARQIKHTKAFYLTQAGVEWAIHRCRTDFTPLFSDDINKAGGQLVPDRIEDPPGSGYYPPITVTIKDPVGGDPSGITYHIDSTVNTNDIRIK